MRLSRLFRANASDYDENIPLRRVVLWAVVWSAIFVGIALYFKYASLLTPLLG